MRFERNVPDDIDCDCIICNCEDADECEELQCPCCSKDCYGETVSAIDTIVSRIT